MLQDDRRHILCHTNVSIFDKSGTYYLYCIRDYILMFIKKASGKEYFGETMKAQLTYSGRISPRIPHGWATLGQLAQRFQS